MAAPYVTDVRGLAFLLLYCIKCLISVFYPNKGVRMASEAEFSHPDFEAFLRGDELGELSFDDVEFGVPLRPQMENDPFYNAQLHQKSVEYSRGYATTKEKTLDSTIIGSHAKDLLNERYKSWRKRTLVFRAYMNLEAVNYDPQPVPYNGQFDVVGQFEEFDFDQFDDQETIIIPLIEPQIRRPGFLYKLEYPTLPIPVMSLVKWGLVKTYTRTELDRMDAEERARNEREQQEGQET
jgi:hypothetical protein